MDVHQRNESRRETVSVGINHDSTADGSSVIASHPTTRAALLLLPIFCINVTSQGCLATRMLIARYGVVAAAPWRITCWPFVAVNHVFIRIAVTSTGSGGHNDAFFIYKEANLLQVSWNFQALKLAWKVTKFDSGKDGKGLSCPCLEGVQKELKNSSTNS
jgi:hypothetical protein